jgi:ArsR family transcriptional regulator, lead/cadmium/zinc/bismuth-responsive transcriptional repressor
MDEHEAAHIAELFRAFSDTSRVRILTLILESELNIMTIADRLGLSESAVSHHMRGLRQMRIVESRREGKEVFYHVEDVHIRELFQQGMHHIKEE